MAGQSSTESEPPGLAALFLIKFDVKVGYTIAWKRSSEQIELDGVVEYKSLPSGLHKILEDLIYFTHDKYAGLSAFVNGAGDSNERNARFVAVGILVPRNDGRLGRSWLHARQLKELAHSLVKDTNKTGSLEEYWAQHALQPADDSGAPSSNSPFTAAQQRSKARALSTATSIAPEERSLPPYHPALSVVKFVLAFGPLVFTLHREALLRKRLLIVNRPPIHPFCDWVYDISIMSTLPLSLAPTLELPDASMARLKPLFNLGVHDIPQLEKIAASQIRPQALQRPRTPDALEPDSDREDGGWIACTSDEILGVKTRLYDILIESPSVCARTWPRIKTARDGVEIIATQRDLRRYRSLLRVLRPMSNHLDDHASAKSFAPNETEDDDDELAQLIEPRTDNWCGTAQVHLDHDQPTEPTSWGELAYSSFIWWASAGEREEAEIEEEQMDNELLGELQDLREQLAEEARYTDNDRDEGRSRQRKGYCTLESTAALETAVIAYFHRLTKQLFEEACAIIPSHKPQDGTDNNTATTASSLIDSDNDRPRPRQRRTNLQDGNAEQQDEEVHIDSAGLRRMGLDVWSPASSQFLHDFADVWFGKQVHVHRMGVECCGVRIC